MQIELDDFQGGRPIKLKITQEVAQKVRRFKAKRQYKELLQLVDTLPSTKQKYLILCDAYLHLKLWDQVVQTCDKGLELCQESEASDFLNMKGKAVGKQGHYDEKIRLTAKAIELNPKVAGAAWYKLKDYDRALQAHNKAIELESRNSLNYHNKGAALFRKGQFQAAEECFKKAIQLDKKQTISYEWLANTYKELGDYKQAQSYYLKAYEISENEQHKKSADEMYAKANPGQEKGFFSKYFGWMIPDL